MQRADTSTVRGCRKSPRAVCSQSSFIRPNGDRIVETHFLRVMVIDMTPIGDLDK